MVLAGIIQIVLGYLKLGTIAYYFPTSVIKGMLSGIGLLIILKQIPHALGYDGDFEGNLALEQPDGYNTFSELGHALDLTTPGVVLISAVALAILLIWDLWLTRRHKVFAVINGPLVAVAAGIFLQLAYSSGMVDLHLDPSQLVQLPEAASLSDFVGQFTVPDFRHLTNPQVYGTAFVVAIIASIETLLCVEATDKLDPERRVTSTNRELKAQGLGNVIAGLIGGLPITQVIVRSSANIAFGGRTKMSAILHGVLLLASVLTIPGLLNMIPLGALAAILLVVGYKLAKPSLFREMYHSGAEQFVPFVVTVGAILATDLLKGILIGLAVAIFYLLRDNFHNPAYFWEHNDDTNGDHFVVTLSEEASFLNKGSILQMLNHVPAKARLVIDATRCRTIHHDIVEIIRDYLVHAATIDVTAEVKGLDLATGKLTSQEANA